MSASTMASCDKTKHNFLAGPIIIRCVSEQLINMPTVSFIGASNGGRYKGIGQTIWVCAINWRRLIIGWQRVDVRKLVRYFWAIIPFGRSAVAFRSPRSSHDLLALAQIQADIHINCGGSLEIRKCVGICDAIRLRPWQARSFGVRAR